MSTDHEALLQFKLTGDGAFIELIADRYSEMVFRTCHQVLGNREDAEDATQATFLILLQKLPDLHGRKPLGGWLHAVAFSIACNLYRRRKNRDSKEQEAGRVRSLIQQHSSNNTFSEDGVGSETAQILHREIASLPEIYREPVLAFHFSGEPVASIAEKLGCTVDAVEIRLRRGRKKLSERLRHCGLHAAAGTYLGLSRMAESAAPSSVFVSNLCEVLVGKRECSPEAKALAEEFKPGLASNTTKWRWVLIAGLPLSAILFLCYERKAVPSPDSPQKAPENILVAEKSIPANARPEKSIFYQNFKQHYDTIGWYFEHHTFGSELLKPVLIQKNNWILGSSAIKARLSSNGRELIVRNELQRSIFWLPLPACEMLNAWRITGKLHFEATGKAAASCTVYISPMHTPSEQPPCIRPIPWPGKVPSYPEKGPVVQTGNDLPFACSLLRVGALPDNTTVWEVESRREGTLDRIWIAGNRLYLMICLEFAQLRLSDPKIFVLHAEDVNP